jgi:hypothetical protein
MIHSTGQPICEQRTERMYENFVLDVEYQHLKAGGNAGVFVWADALPARGQPFLRAIEVQVLDGQETANYTSHGDVFAIHGSRLTPDRPHPAGLDAQPAARAPRKAGGPVEPLPHHLSQREDHAGSQRRPRNDMRLTMTPAIASGAPAQEWNRSIWTVRGARLTMTVNGETMLENVSYAGARRGRIALEPSGAAEFANIFIKRLD